MDESTRTVERLDRDGGDCGADAGAAVAGEAAAFVETVEAHTEADWILRGAAELAEASGSSRPIPGCDALNPKDLIGADKLPLHLWPVTASALGSVALLNGALKYGRANWRATNVRASIYVDACHRHLAAWFEGEEQDEEGVPHLGSALACLAILADAKAAGSLHDDRQFPGGWNSLRAELTPLVGVLRARHAGRESPRDWTIADRQTPSSAGTLARTLGIAGEGGE